MRFIKKSVHIFRIPAITQPLLKTIQNCKASDNHRGRERANTYNHNNSDKTRRSQLNINKLVRNFPYSIGTRRRCIYL